MKHVSEFFALFRKVSLHVKKGTNDTDKVWTEEKRKRAGNRRYHVNLRHVGEGWVKQVGGWVVN